MTERRLVLHPLAAEEAREARRWYASRADFLGEAFVSELDHAVSQIVAHPTTWPLFESGTRRYLLRRFPYFVVYRELESALEVVAVMHAKRRPGYWHDR